MKQFFSNINLSLENGLLKLDVTENPIIENIEITASKKSFVEIIWKNDIKESNVIYRNWI